MENMSLEEWDLENETDNFGRCLIGRTTINRMMKCDHKQEIPYKIISNVYILC